LAEDCYSRKLRRLSKRESERGEPTNFNQIIERAVSKALQDVEEDSGLVDCYAEAVASLNDRAVRLSEAELKAQMPKLQSELFTMNFMFASSLSRLHDVFLERVKAHLSLRPKRLKDKLLVGVEQYILQRLLPIVERYLKAVQDAAQRIGLESYSISIGGVGLQFTLTFGVAKP
jgi:hypothetical protein